MGTQADERGARVPTGTVARLRAALNRRPLVVDALLYLGCACYALVMAFTDKHLGFRVWGAFATAGYGLALLHTTWLLLTPKAGPSRARSRWLGLAAVGLVGMLAPLVTLLVRRQVAYADWTDAEGLWSAQPEVWVIERAASTLLDTGSPYLDIAALDRAPHVHDYTPYGPVMASFGLPRALLGGTPVADAFTDARVLFAVTAVVCVLASLRLLRVPTPSIRAAQLAVVFPLTALTWATAGPDLAVVGLVLVAVALAAADRPAWAALICALVTSAKLIAAPAAVVVGFLVLSRLGVRALLRSGAVFVGVTAAVTVPVVLVNPRAFTEHVLLFPAGLGEVASPAASPLPGRLLASTGAVGTVLALVLLLTAALAVLLWLIRRPPTTAADAAFRIAVGLFAFTMLTTATRFGYLVYVTVLLGAALAFRSRATAPLGTGEPGSGTHGDRAPLTSS
jgi:hypothetical protein